MARTPPATEHELPDINAIRRRNLRILVERAEGIEPFSVLVGTSRQFVQMLIRPHSMRSIGNEFARTVEQACGRPKNWMDHPNDETAITADAFEHIERQQTSQPEKIAASVRAFWRSYKKLRLELSTASNQNSMSDETTVSRKGTTPDVSPHSTSRRKRR